MTLYEIRATRPLSEEEVATLRRLRNAIEAEGETNPVVEVLYEKALEALRTGTLPGSHPWEDFLQARMRALAWMRDEGDSIEEIVSALSVDLGQIRLLLETVRGMEEAGR